MLETSALESLYGDQITLSALLIKPTIRFHSPTDAAALRKKETNPLSQNLIFYAGKEL